MWSNELQSLKNDMVTKKNRIRCAAPRRRHYVISIYLEPKEKYEMEAMNAQTASWREFCCKQDRKSLWDGIYRVIGRCSKRYEDQVLVQDGVALTPEDSAQLLANTFFPDDLETEDNPYHATIREMAKLIGKSQPEDKQDPSFTESELNKTLNSFNPKKAPGPDGFTADLCMAAANASLLSPGQQVSRAITFPHSLEKGSSGSTKTTWEG